MTKDIHDIKKSTNDIIEELKLCSIELDQEDRLLSESSDAMAKALEQVILDLSNEWITDNLFLLCSSVYGI